jgi:hypothetical protein
MNKSFHKSWAKVRDAPIMQLISEQAYHYMTTYGFERMGVYDESTVFIPNEQLNVPDLKDGIKLTVINGYTKKQLKEKVLKILNSGMALKSVDEIVAVAKYVKLSDDEVIDINNREVRIMMFSHMDLIPEEPSDFLRMVLLETIGRTLLINNRTTVDLVKESEKDMADLFEQYDEHFNYQRLAEIFKRFKPIFLAFRERESMKPIINLISHLSDKYHKPMKQSYLNNITSMLNRNIKLDEKRLKAELDSVNIFRKIRLAQSLSYRMSGSKSILYKVRNGKSFATEMNFTNIKGAEKVFDKIVESIAKDLKHLKNKEFYIPENLFYALPATEKQFTGNIPSGSYISVPNDMVFGVWWKNVDGHRIDLDLSAQSLTYGKIGWDADYRSGNRSLMFSGDVTDAPGKGATEMFHIDNEFNDIVLLNLNYFNFGRSYGYGDEATVPVPFKIIVGEESVDQMHDNYMCDPNNVKCVVKSVIDVKGKILGLATSKDGECRFYFSESAIGNEISVKGHQYMNLARDYMANFAITQITFNEILEEIGAKIVRKPTKKSIDLSIENLQKDTFINLLTKE